MVPEVKKNQQGVVVFDRRVVRLAAPACAANRLAQRRLAERALPDPPDESERRARRSHGGRMVRENRHGTETPCAPDALASQATSSGISLKLVGTQTAPRRKAANIDQNISSQFLECTRMRSPLTMPRAESAAASAETRASISRQVQDRSRPDEASAVAVPARVLGQEMREIHDPARHPVHADRAARLRARSPPVAHRRPIHCPAASSTTPTTAATMPCLVWTWLYAGRITREKARQLIRRHHEIHRGHHQQHDAEHGQNKLHGYPPKIDARSAGSASVALFRKIQPDQARLLMARFTARLLQ